MHVNAFRLFTRSTGGVQFHSIRNYVPERPETVVTLEGLFGSWRHSVFIWKEAQRITGLNFGAAPSNVEPEVMEESTGLELERLCNA